MGAEMERRFFEFMTKREALRLKKESGAPWPWSDDPILNTYKFTNVKREHDRTTRWMRENWTRPHENRPAGEIIFNCALFRYFGTTEFAEALGWQFEWAPSLVIAMAKERMSERERVFTGAYIIPTLGKRLPKCEVVCNDILSPLWEVKQKIGDVAVKTQSWRKTAEQMMRLRGFGGSGFMTKETLQDVLHTPILDCAIDRNTWCPAGPGARRGLNRIAKRPLRSVVHSNRALTEMIQLYEDGKRNLPEFMPAIELHDIQFQLCEFDKYERVRLGEGRPKARYRHPQLTLRA